MIRRLMTRTSVRAALVGTARGFKSLSNSTPQMQSTTPMRRRGLMALTGLIGFSTAILRIDDSLSASRMQSSRIV